MNTSVANIGCAVRGCANSVIGQCTGYKGTCGRFYCADHSTGTLCAECANRKSEDERVQRIYEDYSQTAKEVERYDPFVGIQLLLLGGAILWAFIAFAEQKSALLFILVAFGLAAVGGWYRSRVDKVREARIDEIAATKPGFRKFYETWVGKQAADRLKKLLVVAGVIAAGAVGAVASEIERSQKEAQFRESVDRAVDDELRRRGL